MALQHAQKFRVSPFAIESTSPTEGYWIGIAKELRINFDEPDRPMVEVLSDADPRTYGLAELIEDAADEARWRTVNGSTMWARPLRRYDAVALGSAPFPVEQAGLADVLFGAADPPSDYRPGSLLELRPDLVWEDDAAARQKTIEIADVVAHDVQGRRDIEAWRKHMPLGLLGWAPTKVPVKAANVGPKNARFVTPAVAEMLWDGQTTGLRREHIIARSNIVKKWDAVGPDPRALAPIIWAYRFAIVLTTIDEARRIDRDGAKVGGCERYASAGVHTVYDRLQRRDIDVALLDPEHERHAELELTPW